tara:strand:- start:241 stop:414 length:174 start_codon:yes stop_codon:yes gene_type:complete
MYLARREVGALTSALQRCLARRAPSLSPLEMEGEVASLGFLELGFGRIVEAIGLEAA